MTLFSITIGRNGPTFLLRGIANVSNHTAKFQAVVEGTVFAESANYERARAMLIKSVELQKVDLNELQ
jgi:hypothetical protein